MPFRIAHRDIGWVCLVGVSGSRSYKTAAGGGLHYCNRFVHHDCSATSADFTGCDYMLVLLPVGFSSAKAEWVEQVIVINGNQFEFTPPYADYVTCQTYNPADGTTSVFDEIMTHSTQDVVISNEKIYVAAGDSIIMYDANTLERLHTIAD